MNSASLKKPTLWYNTLHSKAATNNECFLNDNTLETSCHDSFDFVPTPKKKDNLHGPKVYKAKLPRKRKERKQHPGYAHSSCCQKYYESLGLNEKDLKLKLKAISRHREKSPPKTPEHFWDFDFPDTKECIKRENAQNDAC